MTSLVLTLAGFWAGRYVETTGRGRRLAPLLAVGRDHGARRRLCASSCTTCWASEVVARHALVTSLAPTLLLNLLLALPVYALVRASVREPDRLERSPEVEVLV